MPARHRSRQRALQVLFQVDARRQPVMEAIAAYYDSLYSEESETEIEPDPFMESLVRGTVQYQAASNALIAKHSQHWRLERMPAVDRTILRMAVFEMAETKTPAVVAINEALELARQFSTEESAAFINGVLDAVRKELFPE